MEISLAKEFLFSQTSVTLNPSKTIYVSKDIHKLIEMNGGRLIGIYAVIDTPSGEKLFNLDYSYDGEPMVMDVFVHKKTYLEYRGEKVVNV